MDESLVSTFAAAADVAEGLERTALAEALGRSLATLEAREQGIICYYVGVCQPMRLERIGAVFGLTGQRMRQLRDQTLPSPRPFNAWGAGPGSSPRA